MKLKGINTVYKWPRRSRPLSLSRYSLYKQNDKGSSHNKQEQNTFQENTLFHIKVVLRTIGIENIVRAVCTQ